MKDMFKAIIRGNPDLENLTCPDGFVWISGDDDDARDLGALYLQDTAHGLEVWIGITADSIRPFSVHESRVEGGDARGYGHNEFYHLADAVERAKAVPAIGRVRDMFGGQSVERFAAAWNSLKRMDPDGPVYEKLCATLDRADTEALKVLHAMDIKWISMLARNRVWAREREMN